jgi:hypothetical protein
MKAIRIEMGRGILAIVVLVAVIGGGEALGQAPAGSSPPSAAGALRVMKSNPYYFEDGAGKPVVLIGDYTWGVFSDLDYDGKALLESLRARGLNLCRVWLWWGAERFPEETKYVGRSHIEPYLRPGPGTANDGKPRYDLSRFNERFFERLRELCSAARESGVFLQLITVDAWMLKHPHLWKLHAYHKDNNVNGVDGDPGGTGKGTDGKAGFCSMGNPKALGYQEAYVRKLADAVDEFENIYFEIANENYYSREWELHLCDVIREHEKGRPRRHLTVQADFPAHSDVVQKWDPAIVHKGILAKRGLRQPLLFDTDWIINDRDDEVRKAMWSAVLSGGHSSYMDDSLEQFRLEKGPDKRQALHRQIDHLAAFVKGIEPWRMEPDEVAVKSGKAFALVSREALAAYLPAGGAVSLDLSRMGGPLVARWYDPREGRFGEAQKVRPEVSRFEAPDGNDWVLFIRSADSSSE